MGLAYTFVTTEEGGELTRIEILINRLLKRDEIEGFAAVATVAPLVGPAAGTPAGVGEDAAEPAEPQAPRPTPPGRRPPKRHRRAL